MLWAEDWASSQTGTATRGDAVAEHNAHNPLIDELNKEGFSTLAEFESASTASRITTPARSSRRRQPWKSPA